MDQLFRPEDSQQMLRKSKRVGSLSLRHVGLSFVKPMADQAVPSAPVR